MRIEHLRYMLTIKEEGSISKAAKKLSVNQPYLSHLLQEFEEEMNIQIFERSSRGVSPTSKGKEILGQFQRICNEVDHLEDMYKEREDRSFRLSVIVPGASYVCQTFCELIKDADLTHGAIIEYDEADPQTAIALVSKGERNLGLVRVYDFDKDYYRHYASYMHLNSEMILRTKLKLLISADNPLAKKESISINDLKDQIHLVHGNIKNSEHYLDFINTLLKVERNTKAVSVYDRGAQLEILNSNPNAFMWVTSISDRALKALNLVMRPCHDFIVEACDMLVYREGYTLSKEDHLFVDYLREVAGKIENV